MPSFSGIVMGEPPFRLPTLRGFFVTWVNVPSPFMYTRSCVPMQSNSKSKTSSQVLAEASYVIPALFAYATLKSCLFIFFSLYNIHYVQPHQRVANTGENQCKLSSFVSLDELEQRFEIRLVNPYAVVAIITICEVTPFEIEEQTVLTSRDKVAKHIE